MKFQIPRWLQWRKRPQDDRRRFDKATHSFVSDPKAGLLMACGGEFNGIKLPEDLTGDDLDTVIEYLSVCMELGLTLSFANPGYGARVPKALLSRFEACERKYAELGYQPLTPKAFTGLAGWNEPLPEDEPICRKVEKPETYIDLIHRAYKPYIS